MRKVIIEARLNEYSLRGSNPHVPWSASEIASDARSCLTAGATIIHFHARDPDGAPAHDYITYRDIVASLRSTADMLIHPTLGVEASAAAPKQRISHILKLVDEGFQPDFAPLDMGSMNVDLYDQKNGQFTSDDKLYINTTGTLRFFAERLRDAGVSPYPQVWNISHLRYLQAFCDAGYFERPVFLALALAEGGVLSTHPGTPAGLRAYLDFLPKGIAVEWSTAIFQGNLLPMIPQIVEAGGHISIGIGDYPYPELDYPTNGALIEEVARRVRECGAEVATVAEVRDMLGRTRLPI